MAPLIPDGVYEIFNAQFKRYCVRAAGEDICACRSSNDAWKIENVGGEGNEIIIENVVTPESFVAADEFAGAPLYCSSESTVWTIFELEHGYYVQAPGGDYVWELLNDASSCAEIVLNDHTGRTSQKWVFTPVNEG